MSLPQIFEIKYPKTEGPKDLNLAEPDETKFRIQLRKGKLILTYRTHLNKQMYTTWLLQKGKSCKVWIAHENADPNNPYEHSHVLIMYEENMETRNVRYFDFGGIHPNIKKIVTKQHLLNVLKYMCKEDKSIEQDMVKLASENNMTLFEQVAACKNRAEVLKMVTNPCEVPGLLTMYKLRDELNEVDPDMFTIQHEWQKKLDLELLEKPNPRSIIWICGLKGNEGKSEFVRYHVAKYNSLPFTQFGGARDAACVLMGADWNKKTILIDLPRNAESKSIYEPMEMMKNGMMTSLKYQGGNVFLDRKPHIVVFANFMPDLFTMSKDRWDVRELIKSDKGHKLIKIPTKTLWREQLAELENGSKGTLNEDIDYLAASSNGHNQKWGP